MKYKTTIVGFDKIEKGLKFVEEGQRIIFILVLKMSNIGCRFRENKKLHMEIPVELLEFVSNETPIQGEYSKKLEKLKQ